MPLHGPNSPLVSNFAVSPPRALLAPRTPAVTGALLAALLGCSPGLPAAGASALDGKELRLSLADLASSLRGPPAGATAGATAGKALRLSLADTVRLALDNNRDLDNARIGRVLQRYSLEIAENEFRPRFALGSGAQRSGAAGARPQDSTQVSTSALLRVRTGGQFALNWSGSHSGSGTGDRYSQGVSLTFTQPLLRGAGTRVATAGLASARRGEEQNLLGFRDTVARVVSSVVRLYRAYGQAERNVEAVERAMTRARERYATNQLLVETGRMAEQELVQNRAELKQREFGIVATRNGLDAARLALVGVLDVDSGTRFVLTDAFDPGGVPPPPADPEASLDLALNHRTDYRLARLAIEEAEQSVLLARNRKLWDLSLSVGTNLAGTGTGILSTARGLDPSAYAVALNLNVPLGRVASDPSRLGHLNATVALERARTRYTDLRHTIEVSVLYAVRTVQASHQQLLLARETRALSVEKVEIERTKLASGLSSNFEMVAAEDALLAATNQEIDAAIGYLNSLTALDEVLGTTLDTWGIDVQQVERAGTGLEPEATWPRRLPILD